MPDLLMNHRISFISPFGNILFEAIRLPVIHLEKSNAFRQDV